MPRQISDKDSHGKGKEKFEKLLKPRLWNNNDRVLQDLPRTTNAVEGFHSVFLKTCDAQHLNFFTYLGKLLQENNKHEVSIEQRIAGAPPQLKKYKDVDQRLKAIVQKYADIINPTAEDLKELVRGAAYNMNF